MSAQDAGADQILDRDRSLVHVLITRDALRCSGPGEYGDMQPYWRRFPGPYNSTAEQHWKRPLGKMERTF